MQSHFASFPPSRSHNPTSFASRLDFWMRVVAVVLGPCEVSLSLDKLRAKVTRKGLTPRGLSVVLKEMQANGKIVGLCAWKNWSGWAWSFFQTDLTFVVLEKLEVWFFLTFQSLAETLVREVHSRALHPATDLLLTTELVTSLLPDPITPMDLDILKRHLLRKRILHFSNHIWKFARSDSVVAPINDSDTGIVSVLKTRAILHTQISTLTEQVRSPHSPTSD